MGALEVIAAPSKSYVAINSYKSDRSFPTTLCDLGRVSNIAAAVTLPRTSNFVNRNNIAQSVRSLPYKKRPISEVLDCTNSNYFHENVSTTAPETSAIVPHKKRRHSPESQSSTSALATQSTIKTNSDRNGVSNPQDKRTKFISTETSSRVSSENVIAANTKINSFPYPQNTKRNVNTHLPFPRSTIQTLFLQPVQRRLQETTAHSHPQRTKHDRLHESNTNQLPNQHNVQLPSSEIGPFPTHHSLPMQLQQQNHLMRSQQTLQLPIPIMEQLPTHHSLSMQLQQQNQQLRNENVQLQKQLSVFRQLIKNPQRLNQVIARLEQRDH